MSYQLVVNIPHSEVACPIYPLEWQVAEPSFSLHSHVDYHLFALFLAMQAPDSLLAIEPA